MFDHDHHRLEYDARDGERRLNWAHFREDEQQRWHGEYFRLRWEIARLSRLRDAVATFQRLPFDPELPPPGQETSRFALAEALGCSESTITRLAAKAGFEIPIRRRGWHAWADTFPMPAALVQPLRDWCKRPRSRPDIERLTNAIRRERGEANA